VYETLRNFHPKSKKQIKVFQEMDEALSWLNVEEEALANNPP